MQSGWINPPVRLPYENHTRFSGLAAQVGQNNTVVTVAHMPTNQTLAQLMPTQTPQLPWPLCLLFDSIGQSGYLRYIKISFRLYIF